MNSKNTTAKARPRFCSYPRVKRKFLLSKETKSVYFLSGIVYALDATSGSDAEVFEALYATEKIAFPLI